MDLFFFTIFTRSNPQCCILNVPNLQDFPPFCRLTHATSPRSSTSSLPESYCVSFVRRSATFLARGVLLFLAIASSIRAAFSLAGHYLIGPICCAIHSRTEEELAERGLVAVASVGLNPRSGSTLQAISSQAIVRKESREKASSTLTDNRFVNRLSLGKG